MNFFRKHFPTDYMTLLITAAQFFYRRLINQYGDRGFASVYELSSYIQERITNPQFNCQNDQESGCFAFSAKTVRKTAAAFYS